MNGTKSGVGEKFLVILADGGLAEHRLLRLGHEDRVLVVKIDHRGGVFLISRSEPFLVTILYRGLDLAFFLLRHGRHRQKQHEREQECLRMGELDTITFSLVRPHVP